MAGAGRLRMGRPGRLPEADYYITSDSEFTTVLGLSDATLSGKVAQIASWATMASDRTITGRTFTGAGFTICGGQISGQMTIGGNTGLHWRGIDFFQPNTAKFCVFISTGTERSGSIIGCRVRGPPYDISNSANYSAAQPAVQAGISTTNGFFRDYRFEDNTFEYCSNCLQFPASGTGTLNSGVSGDPPFTIMIRRNTFSGIYVDSFQTYGLDAGAPFNNILFEFNDITNFGGQINDGGPGLGPHSDGAQSFASELGGYIYSRGNVMVKSVTRGTFAGFFFNPGSGQHLKSISSNNIVIGSGGDSLYAERADQTYVRHNWVGRNDPSSGSAPRPIVLGDNTSSIYNVMLDNWDESFSYGRATWLAGNTTLAATRVSYEAAIGQAVSWPIITIEAAKTYIGPLMPAIDFETMTFDPTDEDPGLVPYGISGVDVDDLITEDEGKCVFQGPAAMVVTPGAGLEWRKADDAAMSVNVSAWSSLAGTVNPRQFIQRRMQSDAGAAEVRSIDLTINGYASPMTVVTAGAPFPNTTVWDGTVYLNKGSGLTGAVSSKKFTMGAVIKPDGRPSSANIATIIRSTLSAVFTWTHNNAFSGLNRVIGKKSADSATVLQVDYTPGGTWENDGVFRKWLWVYDSTQLAAEDRIKLYIDDLDVSSFLTRTTVTFDAAIWFDRASTTWEFFKSATTAYDAELQAFGLLIGTAVAPADVAKFNGDDWQTLGPNGLADDWAIMFDSTAAEFNANAGQKGGGGAFDVQGGTVT